VQDPRIDSHDGEIGVGIVTDQPGCQPAPVDEHRVELGRAVHDVAVRQREAVGRDDEAAACAGALLAAPARALRASFPPAAFFTSMATTDGDTRSTAFVTAPSTRRAGERPKRRSEPQPSRLAGNRTRGM